MDGWNVIEETLTDGSKVYAVTYRDVSADLRIKIDMVDCTSAVALVNIFDTQAVDASVTV